MTKKKAPCFICAEPSVLVEPDSDRAVCTFHAVEGYREWVEEDFEKLNKAAGRIAAAMSMGFAGKPHDEIVKTSWDLAIALRLEGKRRSDPPEGTPVNLNEIPAVLLDLMKGHK